MPIRVPFLPEQTIERDAEALLAEYAHSRGVTLHPPVPIEDIVEKHLKLRVDFDDLHAVLGIPQEGPEPDIFGAIWVDRREIFIDQSLDPEERPSIEGRYRFTLAHEGGGHWRLHRQYVASDPAQTSLFGDAMKPTVICRSSQSKKPIEWQADFYASCLLMPKTMLITAWRERFGNTNSRIVRRKHRIDLPADAGAEFATAIQSFEQQRDDDALQLFVRPFAEKFKVSTAAMRIRLEKLGLLHREMPRQQSLGIGS
jgi:Zn-dependent peptidase ImmA (M78 family)